MPPVAPVPPSRRYLSVRSSSSKFLSVSNAYENAQLAKAPIQAAADSISNVFVPFVIIVSAFTFFMWYYAGAQNRYPDSWLPENELVTPLFFEQKKKYFSLSLSLP